MAKKAKLFQFPDLTTPEHGEALSHKDAEIIHMAGFDRRGRIREGVIALRSALATNVETAASTAELRSQPTGVINPDFEAERERLAREARQTTEAVHLALAELQAKMTTDETRDSAAPTTDTAPAGSMTDQTSEAA